MPQGRQHQGEGSWVSLQSVVPVIFWQRHLSTGLPRNDDHTFAVFLKNTGRGREEGEALSARVPSAVGRKEGPSRCAQESLVISEAAAGGGDRRGTF